ncbi:MAG: DsbA family protein, partial [Bradyrhizobium sp.]|nr:DsbA family protein [Bradyrhizobium sp.]
MHKGIDVALAGLTHSRRDLLALLGGAAALAAGPDLAQAQGEPTEASVLRDPDNPVLGNPDGDISIVEWFDFNCPYCRKLEPELRQVVQDDGKVRLVLKDWPILGPVSVLASRVALACKYQGKYDKAHDALIGVSSKLTEPRIYELIAGADVDVDRTKQDLAANAKAIDGMLARNNETAEGLGFQGTP